MSAIATAVVGSAIVGYVASDNAADSAANSQNRATQAGIGEQRYQFDRIQELLKPYVDAGSSAVGAQSNLLGLSGPENQQKELDMLQASPEFQAMLQQGEQGILQNASATGGLRGGNTQAALAQFRPQLLSELINSRFNRLGNVAGMGQASAANQAVAAQNTGANITSLLGQQGAIQAGQTLAQGQNTANFANSMGQLGLMYGMGGF